jgi:hypothetical protein
MIGDPMSAGGLYRGSDYVKAKLPEVRRFLMNKVGGQPAKPLDASDEARITRLRELGIIQ